MKNICTLSDKNYLHQGLALYESINESSTDFVLHYLCLDKESYNKLISLNLPNLIPFDVNELIVKDENLRHIYNTDYKYFCYSLATYFSNFLLKQGIDSILYCDSDIYFHKDINSLYDRFLDIDVAIFKHRQFTYEQNRPEGAFNVGVVYFKNSTKGMSVSDWWTDAVMYRKYPHLATCGDQKYLDEFPRLCEPNEIYIDGDVGHGAPWQWQLYDLKDLENNKITYNGEEQEYIFTHFSQFKFNLRTEKFIHSFMHQPYTNNNKIFEIESLDNLYKNYFNVILDLNKKYFI
jgi:hypothetical protein